jgi:hypothetical protein
LKVRGSTYLICTYKMPITWAFSLWIIVHNRFRFIVWKCLRNSLIG